MSTKQRRLIATISLIAGLLLATSIVIAGSDPVLTNPTFTGNLNGWTYTNWYPLSNRAYINSGHENSNLSQSFTASPGRYSVTSNQYASLAYTILDSGAGASQYAAQRLSMKHLNGYFTLIEGNTHTITFRARSGSHWVDNVSMTWLSDLPSADAMGFVNLDTVYQEYGWELEPDVDGTWWEDVDQPHWGWWCESRYDDEGRMYQEFELYGSAVMTFTPTIRSTSGGNYPELRLWEVGPGEVITTLKATRTTMTLTLSAGDYQIGYDDSGYTESVCQSGFTYTIDAIPAAPPTSTWGAGGWIYYPLESHTDLGFYKTYSQSSQYGLPYNPYNIWKASPDAMAYSIAQLEIVDVGQNFLGYYVKARINAWPDVPSTTIRYEGLSSVEVSPGELVGAQCPIGRVANRWEFGPDTYHLLLGVWFPDEETPFNPASWMTRRPTAGACQVAPPGGGEPAPGGPGPGGLWEPVCRDCPRPGLADLFNIGKWVDWLGCTISNLILCWLVRLINTVIAWVMWLGQTAVAAMGWITSQLNGVLNWLGSAWNNLRTGLTNIANSAIRVVMESDLVQFVWAGIELARQAMGQVWELVLGLWSLMESAWSAFTNVTGLLFDIVDAVRSAFAETKVDIFDFFGVATGTGGQATGLVPDGGGGYGTMAEALAADGPNTEKAFYILTLAIGTADAVIGDTGLIIFTYLLMAAIGWSVITWTLKQFQDILVW